MALPPRPLPDDDASMELLPPALAHAAARYPLHLAGPWRAPDGTTLVIRPIHPDDESLLIEFHEQLSSESVYGRYFGYRKLAERTAHDRLDRIVHIDYDRVMVLVAEHVDASQGIHEVVAVGRLMSTDADEAEFAMLVADAWQRRGIGTELLRRLVEWGRSRGLGRVVGDVLHSNTGMLRVCRRLNFSLQHDLSSGTVRAELDLQRHSG